MKSENEIKAELEKLRDWVKKLLPNDWDKYDVQAKYDSTLTMQENKNIMRKDLKVLMGDLNDPAVVKEKAAEVKAEQERLELERIKQAEAEASEYNKKIYCDHESIDKFYEPLKRSVNKICQGYSHLLFVKGRGGLGKSYQIRKGLIENKADFVEVTGEVTEAYLYRLIYENNGKVLWFKDVVKLLQNVGSLNLLKSATESEENRLLTKSNYSKAQEDLPDRFICKCSFIFDYNHICGLQLKEDFEAFTTRGDRTTLTFSDVEIKQIMRLVAKTKEEKEVTEFLIENADLARANLRMQWKAFKTYEYCNKNLLDWKTELKKELGTIISPTREMLYSLIGSKVVKSGTLKQMLLKHGFVNSIRTADRKVNEWIYTEELFKWSDTERNFMVGLTPREGAQRVEVE